MDADTVLVPLDGSTLAEVALPYAEAVARATAANLRLLSVLHPGHEPAGDVLAAEPDRIAASLRHATEDYLRRQATLSQEQGTVAEVATASGDPIEQIIAAAEAADVMVVVMSTQGQSGLKRWYLGGVADAVLRTTTKPVLLVPPEVDARAHRPMQFARIAVPLDGSELAEAALPIGESLARPAHGQLILLHVLPMSATAGSGASSAEEPAQADADATAGVYLASAQAQLRDAAAATTVVLRGTPSDAIAQYLAANPANLLVMTAHGRGGRKHLVLGSTTYRLLHAGTPVLLVRSRADLARFHWQTGEEE